MFKASFTYSVITEESAEHGDHAEHGWILPGGWEYPLESDLESVDGEQTLSDAKKGYFDISDLSEAVSYAQSLGICQDSGDWMDSVDPDSGDYSTDEQRFYSMHIEGVTAATYNRIVRLVQNY